MFSGFVTALNVVEMTGVADVVPWVCLGVSGNEILRGSWSLLRLNILYICI